MLLAMCFSVASMKSGEGAAAAAATDSLIGAAALEGDAPPAPEDAATAARRGEAFFADTSFLCRFCFGFRGKATWKFSSSSACKHSSMCSQLPAQQKTEQKKQTPRVCLAAASWDHAQLDILLASRYCQEVCTCSGYIDENNSKTSIWQSRATSYDMLKHLRK